MPSSARKIASVRATEAGKQISSLNAATHGLTAQTAALAFKALSGDNSSLSLLNREYQRILKTLAEMQTASQRSAQCKITKRT